MAEVLVPEPSGAHFNLGNVRLAQGRLLKRLLLARAIETAPICRRLNNLGTALQAGGSAGTAPTRQVLKMQPGFADAK